MADTTRILARALANADSVVLPRGAVVRRTATGIVLASASSLANAKGTLGVVENEDDIAVGKAGDVVTDGGPARVNLVAGLTVADGDVLFLSTTAGKATNVPPTGGGEARVELGMVETSSVYPLVAAAPYVYGRLRRPMLFGI